MKSRVGLQLGAHGVVMVRNRVAATVQVRAHGTARLPRNPRDLQVQPAPGGVLVNWTLPSDYNNVTGYRIYVGTESNLVSQIRDRGTRQQFVPLTAGATPPTSNIFVSVVNGFQESSKIQVQGKPLPDPTSPGAMPTPTQDWLNTGGLNTTQNGSFKVPLEPLAVRK